MTDPHAIQHLARKCANANLRLHQSVQLFEVLYLANATAIENGNLTRAAARAGIRRTSLLRIITSPRGTTMIGETE